MQAPRTTAGASGIKALWRSRALGYACAATGAALVAAGCGSDSKPASAVAAAAAPSCLPATTDRSAKLAGVPVDVSPGPGSGTADPHTQISFLGVAAGEIHQVSVVGARSGPHSGRLLGYSQDDGASFVPASPFDPGEQVTVRATIGASGGGTPVDFGFRVDTPSSTAAVKPFPNPIAAPSDYQTFTTLPGVQAPILTVTTADRDSSAGDVFTTNGPGAGHYGLFIYTPQGQLVWVDQTAGGVVGDDLNVQEYDGQRDLTFWQGRVLSLGFGEGEDIVMNSHYQVVARVKAGNGLQADLHEFQIAPHAVAYVTAYNPIRCDLSSQGGPHDGVILDATAEAIDIKTGLVRWEWHALGHIRVSESDTSPPSSRAWDWFHINSIDPEPDGKILVSARNTLAAYQLQGGSGQVLWRLGGLKSSFAMGPGTKTYWQHDGRVLPNGDVTLFDDASPPSPELQSRAVTIALDLRSHRARLVSAYTHADPPLRADSQGNMQTLPGGNTLVGFGGEPQISEFSKGGSLLFDAHLPYDMIFYRAFRHPWSGQPLTPPAAVANLNNVAETIVHMSWNGATGVASWRVLAGKRPGSLAPQATVRAAGFESSTVLAACHQYVAVQALDSAGHLLGTSRTTRVLTYVAADPLSPRRRPPSGPGSVVRC
jgi:hypothetical protein